MEVPVGLVPLMKDGMVKNVFALQIITELMAFAKLVIPDQYITELIVYAI